MPENEITNIRFYWPSVSGYEADGSLSFRLTGAEGDTRYTGHHDVPVDSPDFAFWQWLHENRAYWPSFFEERFLCSLQAYHSSASTRFSLPPDGIYLIVAPWSGPSKMVEHEIRQAMARRAFPLPVSFIDTDSAEIESLFPQFRPFLHGWGEIFGVRSGRCDLFFSPDGRSDTISSEVAHLYKHYEV